MQSSETTVMGSQCCGTTRSFVPIPLSGTHCQMPTPLVLAALFPSPAPFFGRRCQPKGRGSFCTIPIHLPKVEPGWLLPTRVSHVSGVGVSLQPPACSRWTRAPAGTTPCAGISTPRRIPADPSSSGGAEGTATALKARGSASGGAKPQQVRQPLALQPSSSSGGSPKTHL